MREPGATIGDLSLFQPSDKDSTATTLSLPPPSPPASPPSSLPPSPGMSRDRGARMLTDSPVSSGRDADQRNTAKQHNATGQLPVPVPVPVEAEAGAGARLKTMPTRVFSIDGGLFRYLVQAHQVGSV